MSYNSLIHACGVKGNIQAAEGWLEDMLQRQLPASVTTFASLIDACAKAGDLERAEKWMQDLRGLSMWSILQASAHEGLNVSQRRDHDIWEFGRCWDLAHTCQSKVQTSRFDLFENLCGSSGS